MDGNQPQPGQVSSDGRWVWTGQQWVARQEAATPGATGAAGAAGANNSGWQWDGQRWVPAAGGAAGAIPTSAATPPSSKRIKPWMIAAFISWGIAFFEYMIQVPANRIGYQAFSLPQLKILQEVITLSVFVPFAVFFMKEKITWNYLGAAACLAGAVFFIFRK